MIPPVITSAADVPTCPTWPRCGCSTCTDARRAASAPMLPPAIDLAELRVDVNTHTALGARLIREGRREYADTILADLRHCRDVSSVTLAQVAAWGRGEDAAIVASNIAWRGDTNSNGCEPCALAALASGDAASRCQRCNEERS